MKFIEKEVLRVKFRYSPIVLPKSRVMRYTFSNYQYTFSLTIYRTLFPSSLKNDTRFLRVYTFSKVKTVLYVLQNRPENGWILDSPRAFYANKKGSHCRNFEEF